MNTQTLDARGLICPLPVLKARKRLLSMQAGDVIAVTCTDANARKDFPLFCAEQGYVLQGIAEGEGFFTVTVLKPF